MRILAKYCSRRQIIYDIDYDYIITQGELLKKVKKIHKSDKRVHGRRTGLRIR